MTYRDAATANENAEPILEDGLRDVLAVLKPFDNEEATSILAAVAALYGLPLTRTDSSDDDS